MAVPNHTDALRTALVAELRSALDAAVGQPLTTVDAQPASGPGWLVAFTAGGTLEGRLEIWIDDAGAQSLARALMGLDEPAEPAVVVDMLRELSAQAAAATALKDGFAGLTLTAGTPARADAPAGADLLALTDGAASTLVLATAGAVVSPAPMAPPRADGPRPAEPGYPGNLAALLDVDLPLVVRFARAEMSLRVLAQLGPGSMVDMGRSPDAPVQLLIGSQVIAEGEVVVVAGNYGVRITNLVSPADRLRAMEL